MALAQRAFSKNSEVKTSSPRFASSSRSLRHPMTAFHRACWPTLCSLVVISSSLINYDVSSGFTDSCLQNAALDALLWKSRGTRTLECGDRRGALHVARGGGLFMRLPRGN